MKKTLLINQKFNLIQAIRLVHALTESDYKIVIPHSEIDKFSFLKRKFNLPLSSSNTCDFDITSQLHLSHLKPYTSVGDLSRPLIFPSAIPTYCHSIWSESRSFRYSFQGLVTEKRKSLIEDWLKRNRFQQIKLSHANQPFFKLRRKILSKVLSKIGLDYKEKITIGSLILLFSDRGRRFPIKAWDDQYYRVLANSKFVLCPSGDCIWTYRFFESILCGAIPIIEEKCEAYEGFRFITFQDHSKLIDWCLDDAEYNYELCIKRITIPKEDLNQTISRIIK